MEIIISVDFLFPLVACEDHICLRLAIWHAALVAMQLGHQDLSSAGMNYKADGTWVEVGGRCVHFSDRTVCLEIPVHSHPLVT